MPDKLAGLMDESGNQETPEKLIFLQKLGLSRIINSAASFDKRIVFILTNLQGRVMNEGDQTVQIDIHKP